MNDQVRLSALQQAEAHYLADNWSKIPRRERRSIVRLWWRTGMRIEKTFSDQWRKVIASLAS